MRFSTRDAISIRDVISRRYDRNVEFYAASSKEARINCYYRLIFLGGAAENRRLSYPSEKRSAFEKRKKLDVTRCSSVIKRPIIHRAVSNFDMFRIQTLDMSAIERR